MDSQISTCRTWPLSPLHRLKRVPYCSSVQVQSRQRSESYIHTIYISSILRTPIVNGSGGQACPHGDNASAASGSCHRPPHSGNTSVHDHNMQRAAHPPSHCISLFGSIEFSTSQCRHRLRAHTHVPHMHACISYVPHMLCCSVNSSA